VAEDRRTPIRQYNSPRQHSPDAVNMCEPFSFLLDTQCSLPKS
jgi:hypothetical protein